MHDCTICAEMSLPLILLLCTKSLQKAVKRFGIFLTLQKPWKRHNTYFWMYFATLYTFNVMCCVFCTGHFVIVPINLICLHCLQHFFFCEHLKHSSEKKLLLCLLWFCIPRVLWCSVFLSWYPYTLLVHFVYNILSLNTSTIYIWHKNDICTKCG